MDRIESLKEFLIVNSDDSFIKHALALEYIKLGDDTTAKRLFEELLERDENYIGSYYHLAKLLERAADNEAAIKVYEKGMKQAKLHSELHAYNELQSAYEELVY